MRPAGAVVLAPPEAGLLAACPEQGAFLAQMNHRGGGEHGLPGDAVVGALPEPVGAPGPQHALLILLQCIEGLVAQRAGQFEPAGAVVVAAVEPLDRADRVLAGGGVAQESEDAEGFESGPEPGDGGAAVLADTDVVAPAAGPQLSGVSWVGADGKEGDALQPLGLLPASRPVLSVVCPGQAGGMCEVKSAAGIEGQVPDDPGGAGGLPAASGIGAAPESDWGGCQPVAGIGRVDLQIGHSGGGALGGAPGSVKGRVRGGGKKSVGGGDQQPGTQTHSCAKFEEVEQAAVDPCPGAVG